jgi:ubiquinone/menaquinone biosynthesis C-methylase UbiE
VRAQRAATRALLDLAPDRRCSTSPCGPGHLTAELAVARGADGQVLAVDRQPSMVVAARERTGAVPGTAPGRFLLAEATALPIADATCDRAVSVQVLEHVPDVPAALRELHRVVRPGGRVVRSPSSSPAPGRPSPPLGARTCSLAPPPPTTSSH